MPIVIIAYKYGSVLEIAPMHSAQKNYKSSESQIMLKFNLFRF